ncbi:MAG: diaminopimelate decarboxylase [Halieaceae bacterium]|nr:diaminopimelate decarboxylase [Halieaceae bacterium]
MTLPSFFSYADSSLYCENMALSQVADQFGTPCYVYSKAAITQAMSAYLNALGDHPGMICYAVKANSNLAVLQLLAELGAGFDIVSAGELARVLAAGGRADRVVFSGVAKKREEMVAALEAGIHCFNVESVAELELLAEVAQALGKEAPVSLRVNPDVDAKTHPYISTGLAENKFGVSMEHAYQAYAFAQATEGLRVIGIDCHIGSQLTELAPFKDALDRVLDLVDRLREAGIVLEHVDAGGGLGVRYKDETPPDITDYVQALKGPLAARGLGLMLEPGRSIVANAGTLITQVDFLKTTEKHNFALVDAAMNDLLRPALYQAWMDIKPLEMNSDVTEKAWNVVGPVCETGDFLGKDRRLALSAGDRLAVLGAGAYGFVMASNYNTRPRAAEIMIDGHQAHVVRARETVADLFKHEHLL